MIKKKIMSVLIGFFRETGRQTFKSELQLNDPNNVYVNNTLAVEDYTWKGIQSLGIISGFRCGSYRHTIVTLQRVQEIFPESRMIIVCKEEIKRDMAGVQIPEGWTICCNVDELEQALGETFTQQQRRKFEQRFLPRYMEFAELPPPHMGGRRLIITGRRPVMEIIRSLMVLEGGGDEEMDMAVQRSLEDYQNPPQVPIREQKRQKHEWDELLGEVVPLPENPPDGVSCCVCMENYSTIQMVDIAGKCDHVVMCDDCAKIIMDNEKKCPVCRATAVTVRKSNKHLV